jgi:8-oxo-dGTP pyrophosphatase MutT (NUDIX family)
MGEDGAMDSTRDISSLLLSAEEAAGMDARGPTEAAVLLALYGWPDNPGLIFTERGGDLRRHAGEVSFPGGRQDAADADLEATALREANEEIALDPAGVEVVGALPPVSTFVTGYRIQPFVGLVDDPAELHLQPNPTEVEVVLAFTVERLREGYEMRRLIRRGVPVHTPTYEVDGQMIWGATARILGDFLKRLSNS